MRRSILFFISCILLMAVNAGTIAFGAEEAASEKKEEVVLKTSERQFTILEQDELAVFP